MGYFPAFLNMNRFKVLVVGGGNIAYDKLQKLLDFTKDITVISLNFSKEILTLIRANGLSYKKKIYQNGDIDGFDLVIVAVNDLSLQERIYLESRDKKTLCNCVDLIDYCDFIFPSYIKKGDLIVAISTSGASPALSKQLRQFLQKVIPDSIDDFLEQMKSLRDSLPKGENRMKILNQKVKDYFKKLN